MSATRRYLMPVVLLSTVSAMGCESSSSSLSQGAVTVTVDTVTGIEYVRNQGPPPAWSTSDRLALGSIGFESVPDDLEFGRITGVVSDEEGRIYVADGSEIRVFDSAGTPVGRFGGAGAGPGEIRSAQSIAWLGDTLAVLDPGNGRLGLFSPTGEWAGHRAYMALSGPGIRLHPVGLAEIYMPFVGSVGQTAGLVYVRHTPAGPSDTLIAYPDQSGSASELGRRADALRVLCRHSGGSGISSYSADLAPGLILVPAPEHLRAVAWSAEYRIALIDAAGDTVRVIERDMNEEAITDAEWAGELRKFQAFLDTFEDESCNPRLLPRPAQRKLLVGIHFDIENRMWVERDSRTGRAFDVFDSAGRLTGTLDVPERLERVPPHVRNDRLYIVVTDDLDVEYVRVIGFSGASG